MFEQLMQLPLFQGLSSEAISLLVEKYPFHFLKFHPGDCIVEAGEGNSHARFVVSGRARLQTVFPHLQVELSHILCAPHVLGADTLFGITTTYPYRVTAADTCGILQITKSDYISMLQSDKVLLFNILNHLSLKGQRFRNSVLNIKQCTVMERLGIIVETLTTRRSTDVTLTYRQKDFCALLGTQRNTLMSAIDVLADAEMVECDGNRLIIPDLRKFLAYCKDANQ